MRYFKQMSITTTIIIVTQIMAHEFKSLFKLIVFFFVFCLMRLCKKNYLKKISNTKNITNFIT